MKRILIKAYKFESLRSQRTGFITLKMKLVANEWAYWKKHCKYIKGFLYLFLDTYANILGGFYGLIILEGSKSFLLTTSCSITFNILRKLDNIVVVSQKWFYSITQIFCFLQHYERNYLFKNFTEKNRLIDSQHLFLLFSTFFILLWWKHFKKDKNWNAAKFVCKQEKLMK